MGFSEGTKEVKCVLTLQMYKNMRLNCFKIDKNIMLRCFIMFLVTASFLAIHVVAMPDTNDKLLDEGLFELYQICSLLNLVLS